MKLLRRQFLQLAATAAVALPTVSRIARAQTYPTRPVRLLVGFGPGTGVDIIGRLIADKLSEALGKPVIVENVTGAAGHLADDRVAKAEPDGHTLVMAANSAIVMGLAMFEKLTYDPIKDLTPITQVYRYPNVLCVHNGVRAENVQELVALARARPGTLTFGSTGTGTTQHLAGELLKSMAKIDMQHVPYRGGTGIVLDLIAGRVDMNFGGTTVLLPLAREGKIRALAVTSLQRYADAPELPTIAEAGFPGFDVSVWFGLFTSAKTPADVTSRLHRETARLLMQPGLRKRLQELGSEAVGNTPEEFLAMIKAETPIWTKLVRETGIKLD
jgi:tripartite-type tricarboxylate transporter receptor subunit TctC